jgi:hypothetical protein
MDLDIDFDNIAAALGLPFNPPETSVDTQPSSSSSPPAPSTSSRSGEFKITSIIRGTLDQPSLLNGIQFQRNSNNLMLWNPSPNKVSLTVFDDRDGSGLTESQQQVNFFQEGQSATWSGGQSSGGSSNSSSSSSRSLASPQLSAFEQTHSASSFLIARTLNTTPSSSSYHTPSHLQYVSIHDFSILRSFPGIGGQITSISMNPRSDYFLAFEQDASGTAKNNNAAGGVVGCVKVFDVNTAGCQGKGNITSSPASSASGRGSSASTPCGGTVQFDPSGQVFAVASVPTGEGSSGATPFSVVKLYDSRNFEQSFATFETSRSSVRDSLIASGLSPKIAD